MGASSGKISGRFFSVGMMLIITNSWLLAEIDGDVEGGVSLCVPDEAKQSAVIGRQMLQVTINE